MLTVTAKQVWMIMSRRRSLPRLPPSPRWMRARSLAWATSATLAASICPAAAAQTGETQTVELAEVVVTGTRIRGAQPIGTPPIVITQEEIRKGGFTRIEEVLRSLPQNFSGGPREDTMIQQDGSDRATSTNLSKGAAINLRGLGAGTTLVLVDGRRLAPGGSTGLFTDIANLPLAAVERIEVLTDGASALYGSDAVGGVVNVIMRKDFHGAETAVRAVAGAGGTHDYHFSQLFGTAWGSGSINLSYEYLRRDALHATDRAFSADTDQRRNGGDNFSTTTGNPGTIYIGNRTWAIPRNQNGQQLNPASLVEGTVNFLNGAENLALLPEQTRQSVTAYVTQSLVERIKLWGQGMASWRNNVAATPWSDFLTVPSTNPYYVNPTGGTAPIIVRYDLTEDFGGVFSSAESDTYNAVVGIDVKLDGGWKLTADAAQAESRATSQSLGINRAALAAALADSHPATALNPFGDGAFTNPATIDSLRLTNNSRADSKQRAATLLAEGPILTRAAGDIRLAVGTDFQDYAYASQTTSATAVGERDIRAVFAELRVPLVGATNARPGIRELTASLALRHEQYSDFGNSTVPKFGISWSPIDALRLRASWSESFRAPDLASLDESRNSFSLGAVPDPLAATGSSTILRWTGGNAGLKPETADNLTAGLDVKLPWLPHVQIGVTYFDIHYANRLQSPFVGLTSLAEFLGDPNYSAFATRNPDAAYRERVCNSGVASAVNRAACFATPISAIVDMRLANTAQLNTDGVDLNLSYRRVTPRGTLGAGLLATHVLSYEQAVLESFPLISGLNRKFRPVDTRLRANFSWDRGAWSGIAFLNYIDNYKDVTPTMTRRIASWTTIDLDIAYETQISRGLLSGLSLALNVQNLLNRPPPFVNTAFGYDVTNANPYGRVVSLSARKRW
ncbi:MAG: TonB-dependent receptor plug domain-containing protein [Luteimonas sp.]